MEQSNTTVDSAQVTPDIKELQERLAFLESESKKAFETRDKAKQKARELETSLDELKKNKDEELKKVGDYETLSKKLQEKETLYTTQQLKLKEKVVELTLKQLATEMGIKKSDYINLMDVEVDVDDELNVNGLDDVKKKIEAFKKENPDLFKSDEKVEEKKIVPKVDSKSPVTLDSKVKGGNISIQDKIALALQKK